MAESENSTSHHNMIQMLQATWPAFCLGNVAADFQVRCAIPREATHFYTMPPPPSADAGVTMLTRYPELRSANCHSQGQVAFVAGYLSHLLVDLAWFRDILMPHFVTAEGLGEPSERVFLHNMTLMLLDLRCSRRLPLRLDQTLRAAEPDHWLPFANDADLIGWRDYLADQLTPDGAIQTVEIYAERMSVSATVLHEHLNDVEWQERILFSRIPFALIEAELDATIAGSQSLIERYLGDP